MWRQRIKTKLEKRGNVGTRREKRKNDKRGGKIMKTEKGRVANDGEKRDDWVCY